MMHQENTRVGDIALAKAAAAAASEVPGVADLSPGQVSEVATYGPGETVRGVAVRYVNGTLDVDVHVVARFTPSINLQVLANHVRRAVAGAVEELGVGGVIRVNVTIDDLRYEEG